MKVLVFGNSGSGKSTYAKALSEKFDLPHLDLDSIVWEAGKIAVQRAPTDIQRDLIEFMSGHDAWVIEGCYGELVQSASLECSELVFLNPGLDTCVQHNRSRPWEPHKYESRQAQDAMLEHLQNWVREYYARDDNWSYKLHREIFDAFDGNKREELQPVAA